MRFLLAAALTCVCAVLQVSWVPHFQLAGAYPNLVLVAVCATACSRGPGSAFVLALLGGLLLDTAQPGPLGLHALSLCGCVYVASLLGAEFEPTLPLLFLVGAVATAVYAALDATLTSGTGAVTALAARPLLPAALLDGGLLAVLWRPFQLAIPLRSQPA